MNLEQQRKKALLAKLSQLSPEQRKALELQAKQKKASQSQDRFMQANSMTQLFEQVVSQYQDKTAVILADKKISYQQLNQSANRLARLIKAQQLADESLIGIMCDRSLDMIVAIIAVLKAGAVYVPIDPTNPYERQSHIIDDSQVKLLLTQSQWLEEREFATETWCLDDSQLIEQLSLQSDDNLAESNNLTASLAYIIYTSGSTGAPKGVMVEHGNVLRLFSSCDKHYQFDANDVWTLFHSYAFDFSVWEIWGALFYGGTLVIVPQQVCLSPELMGKLLVEHQVTVFNQTPTAFYNLLPQLLATDGQSLALRYVIFGGEALSPKKLAPWFDYMQQQALDVAMINMYGITETTVHASFYQVTAQDTDKNASPIGCLLADLKGYVLNESQQSVPDQTQGELYIAGAGVVRGYLHQPQLTAERFIDHPNYPNVKLYRTGDLVKRMANGQYHYVGRADQQVKIRGFRIELGEIEAALVAFDGIRDAVVSVHTLDSGDNQLAAYLVCQNQGEGQAPAVTDVVAHLHQFLPQYMMPATFDYLAALPLNQNGKIDRGALPAPNQQQVAVQAYVAPSNEVEMAIAEAWTEVLSVERVGIFDNYFDLGGDSIRSLAVVTAMNQRGLNANIADLYAYPVLNHLAAQLRFDVAVSHDEVAAFALCPDVDKAILPDDIVDAYPISKLQEGMIFHYGDKGSSEHSDSGEVKAGLYHNVSHIQLDSAIDIDLFGQALAQLIARHDALRTSFHLQGYSMPLQLVHREVELPLSFADLTVLTDIERQQACQQSLDHACQSLFEIDNAPLIRVHVNLLSEQSCEMIWTEHHALMDGWSVEVVLKELSELYQALVDNRQIELAAPPRYANFIANEQQALTNDQSKDFWLQYLDEPQFAQLPAPINPQGVGSNSRIWALDSQLTEQLDSLAKRIQVSLKSLTLAAHIHVLKTYCGQDDVITGLSLHGRPELANSESSVGLYVSVLPFRDAGCYASWLELIHGIAEQERAIWRHRHLPLSEILQLTDQSSLFDYSFNFLDFSSFVEQQSVGLGQITNVEAQAYNEFAFATTFERGAQGLLNLGLNWDLQALDDEQVVQLYDYYVATLTAMVEQLQEAPFVLDQSNQAALVRFNPQPQYDLTDMSLTQLISEQVGRFGDKTAVEYGAAKLSYAELDAQSNQLAGYLVSQGVKAGDKVALVTHRSLEMMVSLLAIIKTGACYVPVDAKYPIDRIEQMLNVAQPSMVLWQSFSALEAQLTDLNHQLLSQALTESSAFDCQFTAVDSQDSLLNLIFTSGTTGEPKGVEVVQQALIRLWQNQNVRQMPAEDMVMLQVSALAFDAATEEIWLPLLSGGTLVLFAEVHVDLKRLTELIATRHINCAFLTNALFEQWVEQLADGPCGLTHLTVGGEAINCAAVQRLYQKDPQVVVFNGYGPTENTVFSTFKKMPRGEKALSVAPIGQPLDFTQAYVLDKQKQLLPVGAVGELYLGGLGLAQGYLAATDSQSHGEDAKFSTIDLQPLNLPAARLYATGDKVRWDANGELHIFGRVDDQVKFRGFRIEPAEIEQALLAHEHIQQATVLLHQVDGDKKLVAFVSGDNIGAADSDLAALNRQVKAYVKSILPSHLVPSLVVGIEQMPLTMSGKVDRKALLNYPLDEMLASLPANLLVEPKTETEQLLLPIWQEVLKLDQISTDASFFELGGDSLSATRLVSAINYKLEVDLALNQVFENQSIIALAQKVDELMEQDDDDDETYVF